MTGSAGEVQGEHKNKYQRSLRRGQRLAGMRAGKRTRPKEPGPLLVYLNIVVKEKLVGMGS